MDPLVGKTLELRKVIDCMYGEEEDESSENDSKVKKKGTTDSIQDSLSNSVETLARFYGFHDIDASALSSLTTVVSSKLEAISRQLAILERRRADRLPQPYSSPLLHVLVLHGVHSYSALGEYYERYVRATYEGVRARHVQLSQQKGIEPKRRREVKRNEEREGEEYLQYLGVADLVTDAPVVDDENGNAPRKRRKKMK
ncbi:hypothetical protein PENTCL1PPCAC_1650 [Pristionchus entomophagus]|uniref:Uncharacterized protein n=1 Tax=Pristionchus entomophagus TaxID=358040 RepID=A0AAV5S9U3_9BILA|nr:hypothetical protein PENTCL1PPCAC_1650 [Pristionchus entomophagus]